MIKCGYSYDPDSVVGQEFGGGGVLTVPQPLAVRVIWPQLVPPGVR